MGKAGEASAERPRAWAAFKRVRYAGAKEAWVACLLEWSGKRPSGSLFVAASQISACES